MRVSAEDKAILLFRKLRETLQGYGDNHLAKDPPQPAKARTNIELVNEINEVLVALAMETPLELTEVVRDPDNLGRGAMHIGGIEELRGFLETLRLRDGEDYTAVRMRIADLRTLVGVDAG